MSLTLFSKSVLDRFYFCWRCACTNKLLADWCGGWGSGLQNWTADLNRYLLVESAEGFHDDGGQVLKFRFLCNRGFAERGFKLVKKTKDVVKATLSLRLPVLRLKYAPISIMSYCTCVFFFLQKIHEPSRFPFITSCLPWYVHLLHVPPEHGGAVQV